MSNRFKLVAIGSTTIIFTLIGVAYLLGDMHAVTSMTTKRATPYQLAEAMRGDYFYSNYRENTLLVTGTVASVNRNNQTTTVDFVSNSSYKAQCEFVSNPVAVKTGDSIEIITEGATAVRVSNGVILQRCQLP